MELGLIDLNKDQRKRKSDNLNFRRRRKKLDTNLIKKVVFYTVEILIVIVIAYLIVSSFGLKVTNLGESMSPTMAADDTVLMDSVAYKISDPERNDIVAFLPSGNLNANLTIKRVIGIPGDTIQIKNGVLYVNGEVYDDVINTENMDDAGVAATEITLGEDEYFVLGDNRNNSEDSRFETIGNVSKESIVGKIWFNVTRGNFGLME